MMSDYTPSLTVDLDKIRQNTRYLTGLARERVGAGVFGVTKALSGSPEVARVMLEGGCCGLADSRFENLRKIRVAMTDWPEFQALPLMLLRIPAPSQVRQVVETADISLNSEWKTLQLLSQAAGELRRIHQIVLMVDLGDLREGIWIDTGNPSNLISLVRNTLTLPNIKLIGIGTNLACYGGVIPDRAIMERLLKLAFQIEQVCDYPLEMISGGNSSAVPMLLDGSMPKGINSFRLGESILLGKNVIDRSDLPGTRQDAMICRAEIIELQTKPSMPRGVTGQNAFGEQARYIDRGIRQRAILALGRQDVVFDGLTPLDPGHIILGASSDHLLVDVSDSRTPLRVGDRILFIPNYGALLALATSPYVAKHYVSSDDDR
ncbi:MAG: alanine/ornithine racemase family PLP-dependent enzyme [Candidatus Delongbacteria bacterium]|nr:alanine/ornithine racemase family PLP-dependent enzyme [Candidatus Delongbacteria bacterium]